MTFESNAPVIVGAGVAQQRFDDPHEGVEAGLLMRLALERAADDAGSRALLDRAEVLLMPQGTWRYDNPAAIVAPWNPALRTVVADMGVLQQTLLSRACSLVADGHCEVVMVCGGEAKYRALRAQITGIDAPNTTTVGAPPERLVPSQDILGREEIERGLTVPARQYALIDTALRAEQNLTPSEHIKVLATLWSDFSRIAESNPEAWSRTPVDASGFISANSSSPMLAWPYTKMHCSQWNVDQAAGLIVCSAATAASLGIARDRWVFAHLGVESNLMVPLTRRVDMHRSSAMAITGETVQHHCGVAPDDIEHIDLYSCFPAAVRVQTNELALTGTRNLTVTGGMTFGGGPLNNYTLQALAKMADVLRADPTAQGLVTNVSGMLTKYGASVWSCRPPAQPFTAIDVSAAAGEATAVTDVDADYIGRARVLTYTVAFDKGSPVLGIAIGETADRRRCLATTVDAEVLSDMLTNDWCARAIDVRGASLLG